MKTFIAECIVSKDALKMIKRLCSFEVEENDFHDVGLSSYSTFFDKTVKFKNGVEADIKVCSSEIGEPCWCEVVLFDKNGTELTCSDVSDGIKGDWHLFVDKDEYIVKVS